MAAAIVVTAGFLAVFLLAAAGTNAHNAHVLFGYSGSNGPDQWGKLTPEFRVCSTGRFQSPININRSQAVEDTGLTSLVRDYNHMIHASLVHLGFNVAINWEENAGVLCVGDKNFTLRSMHWHTPSEHTIDGVSYPVELHLVHESHDGTLSVVAILYDYGATDPFLEQFVQAFQKLVNVSSSDEGIMEIHLPEVKTRSLSRGSNKYYRYVGSLTVPPCTENVIWNILGKVRQLSKDQVLMLKSPLSSAYQKNSRPVQPLNGRTVHLYKEEQ